MDNATLNLLFERTLREELDTPGNDVKTIAVAATLSGLCFDLLGAFLLAAEAIGLDTIRAWRERLLDQPAFILSSSKTVDIARRAQKARLPWVPQLAIGFGSGVGAGVGGFVALALKQTGWSTLAPLGLIVGGVVGAFSLDAVVSLLRASSSFFIWVQESVGRGTIGVAGFVLLAAGFVLQFIGSLGQALAP
jgi:hypothetical protein